MEKKCKICGIYKILHKSMSHDFVDGEEDPSVKVDRESVNKIK